MRYTLTCISLVLATAFTVTAHNTEVKQHTGFTENKGQIAEPSVLFKVTGMKQGIYITASGLTHVFTKSERPSLNEDAPRERKVEWSKLDMELEGASILKENIETEDELPGYSNYYYAHCPQGVVGVRTWHKVIVRSVYPGIDWVLTADDKGMAHDFIVHPGADASLIHIVYKGADALVKQERSSKIMITSAYGTLYEGALQSYTENGSPVASRFKVKGNEVSFSLGKYDRNSALIIDPPLQWASQQISTGYDYALAVATPRDNSGGAYVTGFTDANDFPVLNAYQGTINAIEDMFVYRLNTSGTLVWSTYYGGSDYDGGKGVTSDANGNCYVTGYTASSDFPVQNPVQTLYGGGVYDATILKFNSSGVRQWATWYGGLQTDYANAIDADQSGNIYVTGYTSSAGFTTVNPVQATKAATYDAFIMKMNSSSAVQWATFYGGDDEDKARAIKVDPSGTSVVFTGSTISGTFPVTTAVLQSSNNSGYYAEDAFITKMSTSSGAVQFSTFCGGADADFAQGITMDSGGNIYITGYTFSSDFPIRNPGSGSYVDSTSNSIGMHDAFVFECNNTGSSKIWSTYLGGSAADLAMAITYDPATGIYIAGHTMSTDFPVMMPVDNVYYQSTQGDGGSYNDLFVSWFYNHRMQWSTYYGDDESEEAYGISADSQGNIYVAGADSNDAKILKFLPGIVTGISADINSAQFSTYPDPALDVLDIDVPVTGEDIAITIMNIQGQLVRASTPGIKNTPGHLTINVQDLAPGAYIVQLSSSKGTARSKFIKK
jgi:hypothetical protein